MKLKAFIFSVFCSLSLVGAYAQCYSDFCDDDNDIPVPGCCTATTAGMTWSGYGHIGCVNMGSGIGDVWMSFTAPTTGYIQIVIDNITQNGPTQYLVFDHMNAEDCSSLNSFRILAELGCNTLAGDGVGGTTWTDTVEYMVEAGERYWLLVSADTENGGTSGTFQACIAIVPPPPPPPPMPGQDCVTADPICNSSGSGFSVPLMNLGDGNVEENAAGAWSTCIGDETSSQWYTFTASQSGTFNMMLIPDVYNAGPQTGDDFDFELYDITASGCTNAAVSLACDYSGCVGTTGWSSTGPGGWSQTGGTNYQNNNPIGPADCSGGPQWNTGTVNLVAGNTYALMIQNYSNTLGGVTVEFSGTSVMGPTTNTSAFSATISQAGCSADVNVTGTPVPNYTYSWDYGDGGNAVGPNPPTYTYTTPGTYIVEVTVTDAVGCVVTSQQIVDVSPCTPLPVELVNFNGSFNA